MREHRKAILGSALFGALLGAVAIVAYSGGRVERMTLSDGLIARYVAAHFDTPPDDVHEVVKVRGTSLRYGRVGLPVAIWIASAGWPPAMPYVQPVLMVLCAGAISGAARALFPRAPPIVAVIPYVGIGVLLAVVGGFAEALAAALGFWAVVMAARGNWWACAALLAGAMLTRENAGAIVIGLAIAYRVWKTPRIAMILATSFVPVIAWYLYCKARYGHIPVLDPYLRVTTSTIEPPFVGIWHSLTKTSGDSLVVVVLTLALALFALCLWKRRPLGTIAAVAAIQIFAAGPFSFRFIGEAARTSVFIQLFIVLEFARRFIEKDPSIAAEASAGDSRP